MKYNTSQLGDVKGAQATINDQYQKQVNQARFKGLANLAQGQQTRKRMGSLAADARIQAMNEKLDPSVRNAYSREAQMYDLLGEQLPYIDPEKQGDFYYRMMATVEDPRRLANELRKVQMQNEADILKARIYSSAQGGRSNKADEKDVNEALVKVQANEDKKNLENKKTPWYQQMGQGLGTLFAPRTVDQPVPTMTNSYQEQPMLPMGQGIMRNSPSLFQYPDLIGGFSR